jgi:hypothetical protein
MSTLPMLGNLAWAPVPAIENVEVLDRFNGVPTFGLFTSDGRRQLFWRVTGYVPDSFSIWLYIPLSAADESRLAYADPSDLLTGLAFDSPISRYVTVGMAKDYRLIFEREWRLPENAESKRLVSDLLRFLIDALRITLEEDMPPARRELVFTMSRAVEELASA